MTLYRTLYRPEPFRVDDRAALLAFAAQHPFATVVALPIESSGAAAESAQAGHLPLLVDATSHVLRGHVARENPMAEPLARGASALAIFHGPHGYVSPSVYQAEGGVPTWNYVVVHARGRCRSLDRTGLLDVLHASAARFDPVGWRPRFGDGPSDVPTSMLDAIMGFEIAVDSIEGKWKLSQNRSPEDQDSVAAWLERGDASARAVAALMRAQRRS